MNFTKHLFVAFITATLAACGGSSSSDSSASLGNSNDIIQTPISETPNPDNQAPNQQLQSISGATADGYLVHAKVCLDLNDNGSCDDDEPYAMSEENGKYTINNISENIDLSVASVVVEVVAGQTIDEDNPGEVVEKSYRLTAPKGVSKFISPITTLVSTEVKEDETLSIEEATEAVKEKLGIDEPDVDVMEDYVEAKKDADKGLQYERIHKVAQVLAGVIAEADEDLEENGSTIEGDEIEKRIASRQIIKEKLEEIVVIVDQKVEGDFDAKEALNDFKQQVDITLDEIEKKIQEQRIVETSETVDLFNVMENGGIHLLEGDKHFAFNQEDMVCILEKEIGYENAYVEEDVINVTSYVFDAELGNFVTEVTEHDDLVWKDKSWKVASNDIRVVSKNEGGSIIVESDLDGQITIAAKQIDISNKAIDELVYHNSTWRNTVAEDTSFPVDAYAYKLSFLRSGEPYRLPASNDCVISELGEYLSGECNVIFATSTAGIYSAVTAHSQLLSSPSWVELTNSDATALDGQPLTQQVFIELNRFHEKQVLMTLSGNDVDNSGEANFYLKYREFCYEDTCETKPLIHLGQTTWNRTERGIEYDLPSQVRAWVDHRGERQVLTLHDGFIRQAFQDGGDENVEYRWSYNSEAMEAILSAFDASTLREEVENKYCGYYSSVDGDYVDKHEGNEESEKTTDSTIDGQGDKETPVIEHDDNVAEGLIGSRYFVELENEQVVIYFKENHLASITSEGVRDDGIAEVEHQYSEWLINSEGQLLLLFEKDEHVLVNLTLAQIGGDQISAWEEDEGETKQYSLLRVSAKVAEDFNDMSSFSLVNEFTGCNIEIFMSSTEGSEGGGYAEFQACDLITSEMIDFTWYYNETLSFAFYDISGKSKVKLYGLGENKFLMETYWSEKTIDKRFHVFDLSLIEKAQ